MKILSIILFVVFTLSITKAEYNNVPKEQVYTARVTYYTDDGKWGNKVACQTSKIATEGTTVAAHPDFKFGTRLFIPDLKGKLGDGVFVVQDRGPAVTKKQASKGKAYVFDVYVKNDEKLSRFARVKPEYMKIYVLKP
jgi:hypothetical protein